MSPILTITDLHKRFGDLEVLKGIDMTMQKGDVVSLIGSSGSGKTTLLRCVNLLEDFERGSIELDGEAIGYRHEGVERRRLSERHIARQRAMTGMAFQQFNLFPHMTAIRNVMLGLTKTKKMAKDEAYAIAEKWLERVGMIERRDHFPGQLSGGQQQRVALARLLLSPAKLWVLDEPFTTLDIKGVKLLESLLTRHAQQGGSVLVTTHHSLEIDGLLELDLG